MGRRIKWHPVRICVGFDNGDDYVPERKILAYRSESPTIELGSVLQFPGSDWPPKTALKM